MHRARARPAPQHLEVGQRRGGGDVVGGHEAVDRVRAWFRALAELSESAPEETEQVMLGWLAAGGPVGHPTGTAAALQPWLAAGVRDGVPADGRPPLVPRMDVLVDLVLRGLLARPEG